MLAKPLELVGAFELIPTIHHDSRGHFLETYSQNAIAQIGIAEREWVQDNQSFSASMYTLRGMHYQIDPRAQAKIVRVLSGSVFDAIVDLRPGSATFGKWLGITLSAEKMNQLYVPQGFAHGFLTLENNVQVAYKVSERYSKDHERSLNWADQTIGIAWPLPPGASPIMSEKDFDAPTLREARNQED